MYANWRCPRDIENHLKDIYGIDISTGVVSKITDRIIPLVAEWQLDSLKKFTPPFFDAIHFRSIEH